MIFNRPDEKVFASTAKSGEVADFPDILRGWGLTFDQTGGIPPMEWFNALGLRTDQTIQYFLQHGIAEWGESTDYVVGAYAKHNNKIWRSKKRNSGNEPTALNDNWEQAALTLEEVKSLIPQAMTREELEEGTSETPRTVDAALLKTITDQIKVPYATNEEILLGTEPAKAISPLGLASLKASTTNRGLVQLATSAELWGGVNDAKAATPLSIVSAFKEHLVLNNSGYQILPGGLIIQWVKLEKKVGSYAGTYNFPITFPNACFGLNIGNSYWDGPNGWQTRAAPINNSSYKVREDVYINNGVGNDSQAFMIAIGY